MLFISWPDPDTLMIITNNDNDDISSLIDLLPVGVNDCRFFVSVFFFFLFVCVLVCLCGDGRG